MNALSIFIMAAACILLLAECKSKKFWLSKKRVGGRKYSTKCEDKEMDEVVVDDDNINKIAKYLLKQKTLVAWIGGYKGVSANGAYALSIIADRKGKYQSHYLTFVPEGQRSKFLDEHYALCRNRVEEDSDSD